MCVQVKGYCPSCGERDLVVDESGLLSCRFPGCSNPSAAAEVLSDGEVYHLVELREGTFVVRHPLRERIGDALMTCALHEDISNWSVPEYEVGRYAVVGRGDGTWLWIEDET